MRSRAIRPRLAVASLFIGLIVTIGVAWAFAIVSPQGRGDWKVLASEQIWPGPVPRNWPQNPGDGINQTDSRSQVGLRDSVEVERRRRIGVVETITSRTKGVDYYYYVALQFGWPLPAVERHEYVEANIFTSGYFPAPAFGLVGGLDLWPHALARKMWSRGWSSMPLPIKPIWLGLFVDVMATAFVMYGLILGVSEIRRALRVQHGCCVACDYVVVDLAVCPECGRPSPRKAASSATPIAST